MVIGKGVEIVEEIWTAMGMGCKEGEKREELGTGIGVAEKLRDLLVHNSLGSELFKFVFRVAHLCLL